MDKSPDPAASRAHSSVKCEPMNPPAPVIRTGDGRLKVSSSPLRSGVLVSQRDLVILDWRIDAIAGHDTDFLDYLLIPGHHESPVSFLLKNSPYFNLETAALPVTKNFCGRFFRGDR